MFRLRGRVVANHRLRSVAYWSALGLWGAAILALAYGHTAPFVAGIVVSVTLTWLSGGLRLPFGRDPYLRHITRALGQWAGYVESTRTTVVGDDAIAALTPPAELSLDHRWLCTQLAATAAGREQASLPRLVATLRETDERVADIEQRATAAFASDALRGYAGALATAYRARCDAYDETARRIAAQGHAVVLEVSHLRVPRTLRARHAELVAALTDYTAAIDDGYVALHDRVVSAAAAADARVTAGRQRYVAAYAAITDRPDLA